jgi:hypothetical protein
MGVARYVEGTNVSSIVDALMRDSFSERWYGGGFGGRTFDIFQEIPFVEFVIRFGFPLSVIIVNAIVKKFWEFRMMRGFVVGHNEGKILDFWIGAKLSNERSEGFFKH